MVEIVELQPYWRKLAKAEPFTEEEIRSLLKLVEHFEAATAYLADCQAATAESLTSSTSKSSRQRHGQLCESAAKLLDGDSSPIRHKARYAEHSAAIIKRCRNALSR